MPELLVPPAEEPVPAVVLPKLSSPEAAKLRTNFKAMKEIIKMLKKKNEVQHVLISFAILFKKLVNWCSTFN